MRGVAAGPGEGWARARSVCSPIFHTASQRSVVGCPLVNPRIDMGAPTFRTPIGLLWGISNTGALDSCRHRREGWDVLVRPSPHELMWRGSVLGCAWPLADTHACSWVIVAPPRGV